MVGIILMRPGYFVYRAITVCFFASTLLSCAVQANRTVPEPVAQISPLTGKLSTGTIVTVRYVDPINGIAALNSVLKAIGQAHATEPHQAFELIIRRPDHSVTTVVEPVQSGQAHFAPGQSVTIVEAAATVVRQD